MLSSPQIMYHLLKESAGQWKIVGAAGIEKYKSYLESSGYRGQAWRKTGNWDGASEPLGPIILRN